MDDNNSHIHFSHRHLTKVIPTISSHLTTQGVITPVSVRRDMFLPTQVRLPPTLLTRRRRETATRRSWMDGT